MLDKAGFLYCKDHAFLMNNSRQANKLGSNPDFTSSLHSCDALHASNLLIQKQNNSIMENLEPIWIASFDNSILCFHNS